MNPVLGGQLLQQVVSRRMPARVIDDLELVEVHIQQRRAVARLDLDAVERTLQFQSEFATVKHARERIV